MAEDADIKISEMGEAPLPLSGTEIITLVTNNENFKSNLSNIRELFSSGGDLNYNSTTGQFSVTTFKTDDARNSISVTDTGGDGSLSYDSATGVITYSGPTATETRQHFSAGGDLTYDSNTGVFSFTERTDSQVRSLFSAGGDLNYDSNTGAFSVTTFKTDDARNSISVNDSGGDGSLNYDSATGVITYAGPTATEVRAHFSSGTGIDLTNGVISVDSGFIDQSLSSTDDVDFSSVTIDENYVLDSDTVATDSTNQAVLTVFDSTVYRGGKFVIQAIRGVDSQLSELLVLHNETVASATEYGIIYTSDSEIFSTDVDIDSGNVRILVTSSSADNTQYKVLSSLLFDSV